MKKENIITIDSNRPGKTLTIIGGIHGNELCGIEAIKQIVPTIKPVAGKINFVYGNPEAIEKGVRFIDFNLNRLFKKTNKLSPIELQSIEHKRAQEIIPYLDESDALLDIHSSNSPKSPPFIICEPHSFSVAKKLPFSTISYGWDKLEPGGTDYYMNERGKIALCIECGYHKDPGALTLATQSIKIFLEEFGCLPPKTLGHNITPQKIIKIESIYLTKTNFRPTREFADFELLKKNELIGYDGDQLISSATENYIVFCRQRERAHEEAFLLGSNT